MLKASLCTSDTISVRSKVSYLNFEGKEQPIEHKIFRNIN